MRIIGLTGGIASGKTTVSDYLKTKGIPVIDSDIDSKHALDIGEAAYYDVIKEFSEEILNEDKTVNRKKLAGIVFNDKERLKKLNSIVHPRVIEKTLQRLDELRQNGEETAVIDAPLLIEAGMNRIADEVWLVYTPPEIQIKRAMARDNSTRQQVLERLKNQTPFEEKARFADYILTNDGTLEELYEQVDSILDRQTAKD